MASRSGGSMLTQRALNRTLLGRQGLLERTTADPIDEVERLVGLQAQEPLDPYIALWSRIEGFDPFVLSDALAGRQVVRLGLMRTTLHLATAADALRLAPVMGHIAQRTFRNTPFAKALGGLDPDAVIDAARRALIERPMTPTDLGRYLATTWPVPDPSALAYVARYHLSLVQVPPRGLWRRSGRPTNTLLEVWLGRAAEAAPLESIIPRYLRVFGPASVADIRTWSGLTGLGPVIERLRPTLRTFRDEAGRELFDVEDGLVVDAEASAPVRFLPRFDNVFLSHADRSRINGALTWGIDFGARAPILVDGTIAGAWRVRREGKVATLTIELGRALTATERRDLDDEAERLAMFLDPDGRRATVVIPPA
jgi:winged helix DNA-binding protein